jgi:spermidine/putrescine transport system permease protein
MMEAKPLPKAKERHLKLRIPISLPWLQIYSALAILFLFLPIIMIVLFSFNNSFTGVFPLQGFTLHWYREALKKKILWDALQNSIYIALLTSLLAALLGTMAAFGLTRYHFRLKGVLTTFLTIPVSLPTLLIGVSLLSFWAFLSVPRSLNTVIVGHAVYCVPYVVLVVISRLENFDRTIEEAALDLGATPFQTFRHITFPLIRSSIIGAMLLVFAMSFDMFVITFFNIGAQSTLPMVIWSMMRRGVSPALNALAVLIFIPSVTMLLIANRFTEISFEI